MTLLAYSLFPPLLLLVYGGLLTTYVHLAYAPDRKIETGASHAGTVTLGIYAIWMALITMQQGQVPIANGGQVAAFLGFLIWADQSLVERKVRQRMLSLLPISAVTVLLLISIVSGSRPTSTPEVVQGPWISFHITLSLAGVAMLMGSGVYGAGYLILHHQMKTRGFGGLFSRLPSMEEIHHLRTTAIYAGWGLITMSLLFMVTWMFWLKSKGEVLQAHLAGMIALWVAVTLLALAERFRWGGQKRLAALTLSLTAVVLMLILATVIGVFSGAGA